MTLLGKIISVAIFVLSGIFLAFAAIVFATHTDWQKKATELEQQLTQQRKVNSDLRESRQRLMDNLAIEQAARRAALASLQVKLTQLSQQLEDRTNSLADAQQQAKDATVATKTAQQLLAGLTQEVNQLRGDVKKAQQSLDEKMIQLVATTDEVNQARRLHAELTERQLQLANQVAGYENILRKLGVRFESRGDGTVVSDVNQLPPDLKGYVIAISDSNLVEISIGSDDGMKVGDKLDVYRDSSYLGRVVVRKTDVDRSVAEIIPEFRKGIIRKGDRVATNLQ